MNRRDEDPVPDDLRALDAELRDLRFAPRASLGPEIEGRWRAGERAAGSPGLLAWRTRPTVRIAALAAAVLLVAGGVGLLSPFGRSLARSVVVDHCCSNFDGQTDDDDGLLIESVGGRDVRRLLVYEDLDHDGHFSAGDRVRFERRGAPRMTTPDGDALIARRFCCVDYDGGGPADDGLLVVNRPGGGIVLAAIYEAAGSAKPALDVRPLLR